MYYGRKKPRILNAQGKPIRLTSPEQRVANYWGREIQRRFGNSSTGMAYEQIITTLTEILKKISEQKFYKIPFADYIPVRVGEGQWSSSLLAYRSFDTSDDFETGIINTGAQNARQAVSDAAVDAVNIPVYNWAKAIGWSIFDIEQAARAGNWDIVTSKESSRKKNWDLGMQKIAFVGASRLNTGANAKCLGLLNQTGVTLNTQLITKPISAMSPTELKDFARLVIEAYRENTARTQYPTHFVIPESDYNGLTTPSSPEFPIKSVLSLLLESFRETTQDPNFQIKPVAYGDSTHNDLGVNRYALYNSEETSMRMTIPLPYTNTLANSLDNFNFQNTGYGQFTGLQLLRPQELMYFQYIPS